jgi:hypothetical protein
MPGINYLLKRFCSHKSITEIPRKMNPLVECETQRHKLINPLEIHKYLDNYKIFNEFKPLPIQISYFENNKMCKITIHLTKE